MVEFQTDLFHLLLLKTIQTTVFPFFPDERPCHGVQEILLRYTEVAPHVNMSGPTSFAALVNKAVEIVQKTKQYHILIIIADGQVTSVNETAQANTRASNFPLSIVMVGVGDGPYDQMKEFDDNLTSSRFDNFQFVNFAEVMARPRVENYDVVRSSFSISPIPQLILI